MSEQPKQGDRKVVNKGDGTYNVHTWDSRQGKWIDRWHVDQEGLSNVFDEVHANKTDLAPKPIGTDKDGNPVYRLKKNLK